MDVDPFSLPLASPLETAAGSIASRDGFVVRVEREGVVGVGEATPLAGWTESRDACRAALDAATLGSTPDPSETPAAAHGASLAVLDSIARAEGDPLAHLLDPAPADRVPVNATIGDADPEPTADSAASAVAAGFETLKVKAGVGSVSRDVERVRAVRDAIGDDAALRLDANGAWDRERASEAFDALAPLGVEYVEQPLPAGELDAHADLTGPVGVALDEALVEYGPETVVESGVADAVVLKPMALGGIQRAHEVAGDALRQGVDPVVTTTVDGVVARTAAVHLAATVPGVSACGLATADLLERDLAPDPAPVEDGHVSVPTAAGVGIDVDLFGGGG